LSCCFRHGGSLRRSFGLLNLGGFFGVLSEASQCRFAKLLSCVLRRLWGSAPGAVVAAAVEAPLLVAVFPASAETAALREDVLAFSERKSNTFPSLSYFISWSKSKCVRFILTSA